MTFIFFGERCFFSIGEKYKRLFCETRHINFFTPEERDPKQKSAELYA